MATLSKGNKKAITIMQVTGQLNTTTNKQQITQLKKVVKQGTKPVRKYLLTPTGERHLNPYYKSGNKMYRKSKYILYSTYNTIAVVKAAQAALQMLTGRYYFVCPKTGKLKYT